MAYEKKIEPLGRWEIFFGALSLQVYIIFSNTLPWSVFWTDECRRISFKVDIQSFDDLSTFHNCMTDHRDGLLTACAFLLLAYPLGITHVYYFNRAMDTIGAFVHIGIFRYLFTASWLIVLTIWCTVIPALCIFIGYYDWELNGDAQYVGYAMQYQITHFMLILSDTLMVPVGLCAALPWVWQCLAVFDARMIRSRHWELSKEARGEIIGKWMNCGVCVKWVYAIFVVVTVSVILFGSLGNVFDYEKEGFFSYQGGSQYLFVMVLIAFEMLCVFLFVGGCNAKNGIKFLDDNVRPRSN